MGEQFEFSGHYNDLSKDTGFQFEFQCSRCGLTHRTEFSRSTVGTLSGALQTISGLLGGVFGQAAEIGEKMRSSTWQDARDKAFREAVGEIKPYFSQCPRCNAWVCGKKCWDKERGLCKGCSPDLIVEKAVAQAGKAVEEVWLNAKPAEEDAEIAKTDWKEKAKASCPSCGAPQKKKAKFCPECGAKMDVESKCAGCGAKLQPGAKFCGECGEKTV